MKSFACTCGQPLFFDNLRCLSCGAYVAYDPTSKVLATVVEAGTPDDWAVAGDLRAPPPLFRLCAHRATASSCNWLVPAAHPAATCVSCRLTRTVPNLDNPKNAQRLRELEAAKRRVVFALQNLGLPVVPRDENPVQGLGFDFLETLPGEPAVMTGHCAGVVTLNVAEADGDFRANHRENLQEHYRTVIGHLRHELGHYYWDVLVRDTAWLPRFRDLFGDERADYEEALSRQYADGPPADWAQRHISRYAASHPWEDWAESWAHYMHARATLGTVRSFGLCIDATTLRVTPFTEEVLYRAEPAAAGTEFLAWVNDWVILTAVLNETSRSMGQPDLYPFVLNRDVVTKLHFIQCLIDEHAVAGSVMSLPPQLAMRGAD